MTRQVVVIDGQSTVLAADDPLPLGEHTWALVHGRVIDEITGLPPSVPFQLRSGLAGCTPRAGDDGLAGLLAVPRQVFATLAASGFRLSFTAEAPGFVSHVFDAMVPNSPRTIQAPAPATDDVTLTLNDVSQLSPGTLLLVGPPGPTIVYVQVRSLGPGANQVQVRPPLPRPYLLNDPVIPVVPDNFAPSNMGDLALRRQPVVIGGRVLRNVGGTLSPLPAAQVSITGFWRRAPSATASVPAETANLIWLTPALRAGRSVAAGQVTAQDLPTVAEPPGGAKRLLTPVAAGSSTIYLSNWTGLHPNWTGHLSPAFTGGAAPVDILCLDAEDPARAELLAITAIQADAGPDLPAHITLHHPAAYAHRGGTLVLRTSPQAPGANKTLTREGWQGDSCLFLNDLLGLASGHEVSISGGTAAAEYHRIGVYEAASDAEGYYRLPPVARTARLKITAQSAGLAPVSITLRPDYAVGTQTLDFTLS